MEYKKLKSLLTEKEIDICNAIIKGNLSVKKLSEIFIISNATAKTHLYNIFSKLHVHSLAELVYFLLTEESVACHFQNIAEEFYSKMAELEQNNIRLSKHNKNISKLYCAKFREWVKRNQDLEGQIEGMFVKHTDLEMKYQKKEQECEELKKYKLAINEIKKEIIK